MRESFVIRQLDKMERDNEKLTEQLTTMVNRAFRTTESDMWDEQVERTNSREIYRHIRNGEMFCIYQKTNLAGCMKLQQLTEKIAEIGMLAIDIAEQGSGLGKSLIQFGEEQLMSQGYNTLQIELLKPKLYQDESREKLQSWYERLGYHQVSEQALEAVLPELAPGLKVPAKFTILHKHV